MAASNLGPSCFGAGFEVNKALPVTNGKPRSGALSMSQLDICVGFRISGSGPLEYRI